MIGTRAELSKGLESELMSGALQPGQKLPSERELGITYRVSRTVVREALSGLAERGFIAIYPGRGSFVRAPQASDLSQPVVRIATNAGVTSRHLVQARELIECAAARGAALEANPSDVAQLRELLEHHTSATTLASRVSTDLDFHQRIADSSGNPVLTLMFGAISTFVIDLMYRSHSDLLVREIGDPLHNEIVDRIEAGDSDGAEDAMRRHIVLALEMFGDDVDRPLADVARDLAVGGS